MRTMVTARLPGIELTLARALKASQAKGQIINRVKVKLNSYFLVFWEKFLIAWLHNVRRCCCYELMNADLSYCYLQKWMRINVVIVVFNLQMRPMLLLCFYCCILLGKRCTGFWIFWILFLDFWILLGFFLGFYWNFFRFSRSVRDFFWVIYPSPRLSG